MSDRRTDQVDLSDDEELSSEEVDDLLELAKRSLEKVQSDSEGTRKSISEAREYLERAKRRIS